MSKFPFKPNPPYIPDPYVIPQQKEKVDEMKTPEEQARGYVWHNYGEGDFNEYNWDRSAEEIWLAGYKAGREITDQEIVDILVDIRDREAKERSKAPVWKQERHDRIWEKIKIKLVGIF